MSETLKRCARSAGLATRAASILPLGKAIRLYGGTDKLLHGYCAAYERHFAGRRFHRNRVLEIGVGGYEKKKEGGGSLRVWRDHFPFSKIVGFDLHEKEFDLGARVSFVQGDQSSVADLQKVLGVLGGPPNIVIDDGSHLVGHARTSFSFLFPLMPSGSIYVVEDLQTSYSELWGGGIVASADTAVGLARDLVDAVQLQDNTFERRPQYGPKPTHWASNVGSLHVYPGIFFVEKH